jgi:hypothetical protein
MYMRYEAHSTAKEDPCYLKYLTLCTLVCIRAKESKQHTTFFFSECSMLLQHTDTYTSIYMVHTLLGIQVALVLHQGYVPEKHRENRIQNSHLKQCLSWGLGN